jgi:hypothetical protein
MKWLTRLFRRRYRLPKQPSASRFGSATGAHQCATVCIFCGKRRSLRHQHPTLKLWGLPTGICEDCIGKCHIE